MARLAEYIKDAAPVEDAAPAADPVEQVFDFPDRSQPTVRETVGRMVREVIVPGEPTAEELDDLFAKAEQMDAPATVDVRGAFDRGARLSMPKPPDEQVDPALKSRGRSRKNPGGRPAGSDEFTDLFAAGMIVIIAFTLGQDFQPTEDEAKDLARPIGNILARRIDLAKKLGQDANDVIAFSVALMAYSVRVGPVAADRVRESYRDRQDRSRLDRIAEPSYGPRADSVPSGEDVGTGAKYDASRRPLDVIAQARDAQLGVLDRDFGYAPNGRAPLADNG